MNNKPNNIRINGFDAIDTAILDILQNNARATLAEISGKVGLKPPSVLERVKKLENEGVISGYVGIVDARRLGIDITSFIGVNIDHPRNIAVFEGEIDKLGDEILECHHVTGDYTLLLKAKTHNTTTLEKLIDRIRSIPGVVRTYTMVAFSTLKEAQRIPLATSRTQPAGKRGRGLVRKRNGHIG